MIHAVVYASGRQQGRDHKGLVSAVGMTTTLFATLAQTPFPIWARDRGSSAPSSEAAIVALGLIGTRRAGSCADAEQVQVHAFAAEVA